MADVWINEFHYRNSGADTGEFVEVAGLAGTDLTGWRIVLYSGNGGALLYDDDLLSGSVPDQGSGFGAVSLAYPVNGLENDLEGIALVRPDGSVAEFISYGGSFIAADGPAAGMTSVDVGVAEGSGTAAGASIGRVGAGGRAADFGWAPGGDDTPGAVNIGQTFQLAPDVYEPDGNEAPVNSTTPDAQVQAAVTWLADGLHYVVVWVSDEGANGFDVRARTFNADGTATSLDFLVATGPDSQVGAQVAALSGGGFVVVWGDSTIGTAGIWGRIYDSTLAGGAPILLKAGLPVSVYGPSVSGFASGDGFVVTWTEDDGTDTNVMAQVFTAAGLPSGPEVMANAEGAGAQFEPAVAALAGGDYVVVWQDSNETDAPGIRMAIYGQDGTPVGGADVLVNTTTASTQELPAVAALAGGGYVVAWVDWSGTGADTSSSAIRAQIFTSGGAAVGLELLVNSTTLGAQSEARIAALPDGGFVVSWTDGSSGDDDIRAQRFDADGYAVDAEFLVNSDPGGNQAESAVAASPVDGDLVLAWTDYGPVGTPTPGDIERRAFDLHANPTVDLNGTEAGFDFASAHSEGGAGATVADADLVITQDAEHPIQTITISITDAVAGDQLTLAGALPAGITSNAPGGTTLTLTTAGTSAGDLQLALLQVRYSTTSDNPALGAGNGDRTISIVANDGSLSSLPATATVAVTATNDPATISGTATGDVTEDGTLVASGTLVANDPDVGQNSFDAQTGLAGTYGTLDINAAGEWTYTLSNSAANVQALGASSHPTDTITVHSIDGTAHDIVVTVNGVNDAPALTGFAPSAAFLESAVNSAPQLLDASVIFTDPEGNFDAGTLTVSGLLGEDVVSIRNEGTDSGEIGVSGANVTYGGIVFGTFEGGVGDTLTVTFSAAASSAAIDALIQNLAYANASDTPTANRTLVLNVTDADGADLGPAALLASFSELTGAANPFNGLGGGIGGGHANARPVFTDVDEDGDLDLVIGEHSGLLRTFLNDGDNSFSEATGSANPFDGVDVGQLSSPASVDLDGDGDRDLLVGNNDGGFTALLNDGGTFTLVTGAANPFDGIFVGNGSAPAAGDIDGDGDDDVLVGRQAGTIRLWLGDGAGGFVEVLSPFNGIDFGSTTIPTFADLDHDGDQDVVIGDFEGTLRAFLNDGAGAFSQATGAADPFAAIDVMFSSAAAFADLDGDGDQELVTGNSVGTLQTFRNTVAHGRVVAVNVQPSNDAPHGAERTATIDEDATFTFAAGDFGFSDVDVDNFAGVVLTTLPANGDLYLNNVLITIAGMFVTIADIHAGLLTFKPDPNQNGAGYTSFTFQVRDDGGTDNGGANTDFTPATFTFNVSAVNDAPTLVGFAPSVTFAESDVNAAPQLLDADVVFADVEGNFDGGTLTVSGLLAEDRVAIRNEGTGAGQIGVSGANVTYGGTVIGTFEGGVGGTLIVTFNAAASSAAIDALIQNLAYANASDTPTANRTLVLNVTDADGADLGPAALLASFSELTGAANPFNGLGGGIGGGHANARPVFTDVDEDGDLDLVIGEHSGLLRTFLNDGDNSFSEATGSANPFDGVDVGQLSSPASVDLDGDGDRDLLVGNNDGGFTALLNDGGTFTLVTGAANPFDGIFVGNGSAPAAGDIDGDGDDDVLVGRGAGTIRLWLGDGTGAFVEVLSPFNGIDFGSTTIPTFADLDHDGDQDVVIGDFEGTLRAFLNDGAGAFSLATGAADPFAAIDVMFSSAAAFADLDGDGDQELVTGNSVGTLQTFRNTVAHGRVVAVNVTAVNDAPTTTVADGLTATEQVALSLKGSMSVADVDAGTGSLTATLSVGYGVLHLEAGDSGAIVSNNDSAAVTITGTLAQINALLGSGGTSVVTYTANSDAPPATATLTLSVNDGGNTGAGGAQTGNDSATIAIAAVNDAPVADDDTAAATEDDEEVTGSVATNDSDADDGETATLTYALDAAVAGLTLDPDGGYSFDPGDAAYQYLAAGATLDVVASYTVTDVHNATDTATLTITLTGTNDGATISGTDTGSVTEDGLLTASGTLSVDDPDSGEDTFLAETGLAGIYGTLDIDAAGAWTYTLSNAAAAVQALNSGDQPTDTIIVQSIDGTPHNIVVTVNGANDAPVADNDTAAATEGDAEVTGSVATNDSDADDGETATLEYALDAAVAGLTLDPDGGYSFDPGDAAYQYLAAGATTDVLASYTVTDVNGATDTATLTITVTGVNDEPALAATALNPIFVEGGTAADLFNAVTASTVEDGQTFTSMTLTVTNVTEGASEILSFDGTDIGLIDGTTPTATNSLSVTVSVAGSIATISFSGATLSVAQLQILVDTLSYRNTSQAPAGANRVVTITELVDSGSNASPNDNMAAPGVSSTVNVVPVNDAPTSTLLQNDTRTWSEGNGFVTLDVLGNATLSDFDSPDFDTGSLSVSINSALPEDDLGIINTAIVTTAGNVVSVNSVAIGTFSGGSAGAPLLFAFNSEATPARIAQLVRAIGYSNSGGDIPTAGLRTVTWTFNDGDGTANGGVPTLVRTSRVNVVAVNDSPEGADVTVSFNEDTVYYFSTNDFAFDDIENQAPAGVRVESSPTHGTLFFDPDGNGSLAAFEASPGLTIGWSSIEAGNFYYVPAANGNGTGFDSFTFAVVDSGGAADAVPNLFTFDVAPVNDAPVNTVPGPIAIDEEETIAVTGIQVADTEAGPAGAPLSVTLHVDHGTLHVDTGVSGGVGANGVGGNDSGTVTLTGTQAQINATLADAGGLSYTPTAHYNGTDTLSVATSDLGHAGTGGTLADTDTIAISIAAVSDSPSGVDHRLAVNEDVPHVFTAADFTYSDVDGDGLFSVTIVALPLTGTILYDADGPGGPVAISAGATFTAADLAAGRLSYAPLANANGTGYASFTYRVRDTGGTDNGGEDTDASPNTITIDVEAVNDAPTVSISDSIAATEQITIDLKGVIAIGDIDSGSGVITVDLIVDYGILDAVVVPGDAIVAGVGSTGIRITGTLAQVQALLGNDPNSTSSITYTAHTNAPPATATLTVTVYDNGHSGTGGTETAIASETIQLIEINDAPSGTSHDITINEDSANPLTAPDFDLSDVDGDSFTGVVLTTLPTAGTLVFDPDGAGGLPGVLAFAGQFVTAAELAAFGLIYIPAFNGNGPNHASFTFQVRDGGGTANGGQDTDQSPNTMTFNVEPINDAPVLDPNGTAPGVSSNIDYTENDPVTPIAPAATVSDVDNPDYDEGRVRVIITNGISGEDVLSIINQGTGTGQIGYANGIVTYEGNQIGHLLPPAIPGDATTLEVDLEGAAVPVAAVQALLRAIGYISLSDDPPWESRNIEIYVQDPGAPSPLTAWGYAAIHITAVDDPAVARGDAFTTDEATPITTGNLFADNGSGPDSDLDDPLTVAAVAGGTVGSQFVLASGALLTVNADGTFAYDPNGVFDTAPTPGSGASNQPLPDSFTYTLAGGNTGTVTITIIGLDTDDVLIGTAGADTLDGGVGNDFLTSGADGDQLQGGDGDDTLLSGDGDDHLEGGAGRDGLVGGAGIDFLLGGADGDYLFGEDGGDTLLGEAGDDHLEGGAGRDGLAGGAGIDFLLGGADGDYLFGEDGGDTLLGEAGDDHLDGGAGSDGILGGEGSDFIAGGADPDFLFGEGGADTIVGDDGDDVLDGGDGDDGLAGGTGADRLNGGNGRDYGLGGIGDDFIVGGADDDVLLGEHGSDTLLGEAGDDRIEGGAGADGVLGGDANDYIDGGADGDFLFGEDGVDTILGGEGDDHIEAGAGQDGVLGGAGADFILGGADGDYLFGEDGADSLLGGDGDDHLDGGAGADVLIGGVGGDTLIGGAGADLFAFTAALGAGNVDAITDFSVADDTIALDDAVFAGLNLGALSANAFVIGAAAQDGDDRIIYNSATGQFFFDADGSRSGAAVLFATLQPGAALTANDFTVI